MFIGAEACTCWNNRDSPPKQVSTGAGGTTAHAATSGLAGEQTLQKTHRASNTGEQNSSTFVSAGRQVVKWGMFLWTFPAFARLQLRKVKVCSVPCEGIPFPRTTLWLRDGVSCALCCLGCDLMVSSPFFISL